MFLVRVLVVQNVIRHLTQLPVSTVRPKKNVNYLTLSYQLVFIEYH